MRNGQCKCLFLQRICMLRTLPLGVEKMWPRLLGIVVLQWIILSPSWGHTHYYDFVVESSNYTRLCSTKEILTVNGQFPGPTLYARRGNTIVVNVRNQAAVNVTIHWHGVKFPRNPWSDGAEYITQCPIQAGANFSYTINLSDEEGTIWWHAHSEWKRATIHGAIIVYPRHGSCYPFSKPHKEFLVILGEWWKKDVKAVHEQAKEGIVPDSSDAYTINGQPGDLYPCSESETFTMHVQPGNIYLLRVINVGMNNTLFLSIANHKITVVGSDGSYIKPITTNYIMISPGETMDLIFESNQSPNLTYYMAARALNYKNTNEFGNSTTTAIITYTTYNSSQLPLLPSLPTYKDTQSAMDFVSRFRSVEPPSDLPKSVDEQFFVTVSLNNIESRFAASMNNISFHASTEIDVLEAYYKMVGGVFGVYFPNNPPNFYNFTADDQSDNLLVPKVAEEVRILEFGVAVEIVYQGTSLVLAEDHPLHLHGHSFYVVGWGLGNFDKERDSSAFNLVDPPLKNTITIPKNGWVAVRFWANNPGVWYMHCHVEAHLNWGMSTVFIVKNGKSHNSTMLPPPSNMPPC